MTNKEFDSTLHKVVADEDLSFDEGNWELMQARLDEKPGKKMAIIALPVTIKQWAAAACIAIAASGGWWFATQDKTAETYTAFRNKENNNTIIKTENNIPTQPSQIVNVNTITPSTVSTHTNNSLAIKDSISTNVVIPQSPAVDKGNTVPNNNIATVLPQEKKKLSPPIVFNEYAAPATDKRFSISLNGGISFSGGNNISGGITLRNKVSNRISIETNIGYIQGNQNIPFKNQHTTKHPIFVPANDSPVHIGESGHIEPQYQVQYKETVETWYEQHKHTLPYLQLSPAVNIKLLKKLNSSVGVDVQKILIDKNTLSAFNEQLATELKKIPEIDPGITVNLNYSLTKRIGCGIAYRESMLNLGGKNKSFINRDYFMVQLQYAIVK